MSFGPQPYRPSQIRTTSGATRGVQSQKVPCGDKVSGELFGIGQVPKVNVPSVFDDAVETANLIEQKILVNVDGILSKVEEAQSAIQGAVEGAIGEAKSAIFSSISGILPDMGSKDCVALGVPDLAKTDKKAFGGKLGGSASTPVPESDGIDLFEAAIATGAVVAAVSATRPRRRRPAPTQEIIPSVNFGEQPMPDIGLLDGGDF